MNTLQRLSLFIVITGLLFVMVQIDRNLRDEISMRDRAAEIIQTRLTDLESHFIGHTVKLAKNGKGVLIEPCKLNIEKNCFRDDTGISLSNLTIDRFDVGIDYEGNHIPRVPTSTESKQSTLDLTDTNINGGHIDHYEGYNDWHLNLLLFWTHIKQAFYSLRS